MTCIIGAKCGDGVVIASDRRVMRGFEAMTEEKIHVVPDANIIISASGLTGMTDKFIPSVLSELERSRVRNLVEVIMAVEDTMKDLNERYSQRLRGIEEEKGGIDALVAGLEQLTSGDAKLYHILQNGFAEEVKTIYLSGHGTPHALPFVKLLYHPEILTNEMANLAWYTIVMVENLEIDQTVGGIPDVVILKNGEGIKQLTQQEIDEKKEKFRNCLRETQESLRNCLWYKTTPKQ